MDTMSQHKKRPLQSNIDISQARLQHVAAGYSKLKETLTEWDGDTIAHPEQEALWFYLQQHAVGLVDRALEADEPLGAYRTFVESYHTDVHYKALRMFYYLLLICTRESRHASGKALSNLYNAYPEIGKYHVDHVSDTSAGEAVNSMLLKAPDVSLGDYTEFLVKSFTNCSYSGGFGGKAWASIAKPLRDFVHGKISAEILLDTAFTLEHNNGNIFNKGMLYKGVSSNLGLILDVQRSGQIPQLIANKGKTNININKFITMTMIHYVQQFTILESSFSNLVDWEGVLNINGHKAYMNYVPEKQPTKKEQIQAAAESLAAAVAEKKAKHKAKDAAAALLKGSFEPFLGVYVPKVKRSKK